MPLPSSPAWIAIALFALWFLGTRLAMVRLRELPELPERGLEGPLPSICLCIPVRDEQQEVGAALDSWLAQDYPGLRIVLVDDGSRDATPAILAPRAAARPDRLRVLRNETLPPGWLGKNHALDLASRQPESLSADWLLFSDGDVQASPDLLRRAMGFLEANPGDLLALLPRVDTVGLAERVFLPCATVAFLWAIPFRQVPRPGSAAHCGVGAFTLVSRRAYDAVQGHRGAPMVVVDDMHLAYRVKAAGFTNRVARGGPDLHLRMYHGLRDLVVAMRKNVLPVPALVWLAPLSAVVALAVPLSPVLLALTGQPWAGLALWLLVPPVLGEVNQRFSQRPADLAWAFWPLNGVPLALGIVWALADRLRGVNHWRGRDVRIS
jgi:hypothetical protein